MRSDTNTRKFKIGSRCELNSRKPSGRESVFSRVHFLAGMVLLLFLTVLLKLFDLQIASYGTFKALADNQHYIFKDLTPRRGEIYLKDKNGTYPAAVNKEVKMAYAVPKEIEDAPKTALAVSDILGIDAGELGNKFGKSEDMYEVVKRRLSEDEAGKISEMKLKGIHLSDEALRYYPAGELASHVLGFVGWKNDEFGGRSGIESHFEEKLRGKEGNIFQNKDNSGKWIALGKREIAHAENGSDLVLTIDHIIQYETEKILKSAVEKFRADKGAIIVMEPETGRILSLSSYPNFNPNEYGSVTEMEAFRNLAISDAYEPGSVFKAVTLAAAVDDGKINPDTVYTDTGQVTEAGYTIKNSDFKAYGQQTMTQVLEKSLNTGVIYAEKLLGNKNFADYVKRFGFGEATGIDLMGESAGNINNLKSLKSDIQFFTASFGQGITTTPLQLISAYNAIANGGTLMKPQIVEKIIRSDGTEEDVSPVEIRKVISQSSANLTSQMLRSVVVEGHGKRADVPGYLVGGKTGTAQIASQDSRGYEEGKSIGTFCGFAPIGNPKFTVLVRLDNPKDVEWAESSAAPAFGELMKFLLEYRNIEPTEEYTQKDLEIFDATHNLKDSFVKKEEDKEEEEKDDKQ
ncbi:MAG: hypothetical protein QG620_22 [Patescibacteria group bacterium]|nr:hypothetical protein [Patescibacteria group bacterium]